MPFGCKVMIVSVGLLYLGLVLSNTWIGLLEAKNRKLILNVRSDFGPGPLENQTVAFLPTFATTFNIELRMHLQGLEGKYNRSNPLMSPFPKAFEFQYF